MIRGIAAAGRDLGVAADQVSPAAERELEALAGTGIKVFVDSGAFGEVSFQGGWHVKKEITAAEWNRRLDLYTRLARRLGSQLYVVAPDMVGHQGVTLDRLARYADRVRELRALGAQIIVPIQKGDMTQAAFDREVERVLGFGDYIRGVPSKKGATTLAELEAFCADLRGRVASPRVHLLGKGLPYQNPRQRAAYLAAMAGCDDSVRLLAICGKGRALYLAKRTVRMERGLGGPLPVEAYAEAVRRAFASELQVPAVAVAA